MQLYKLLACASLATALSACGGGGGGSTTAPPVVPPTGTASLIANGGNGSSGDGGQGGSLTVQSAGNVKVLKTGTVVTSFTPPSLPDYIFGAVSYTVATTTEKIVSMPLDPIELATFSTTYRGLYVKALNDLNLYVADADNNLSDDPIVTGLRIPVGTTLTVEGINYSAINPTNQQGVKVELANDIFVDGTLTTGTGNNTIDIRTVSGTVIIGSAGMVTTKGEDNGLIRLTAQKSIYNSGIIDASGSATSTNGNNSNGVYFTSYTGSCYSSGSIKANGGSGNALGGDGGSIVFVGGAVNNSTIDQFAGGQVILGGTIEVTGGIATGGSGGMAGSLDADAYGGNLLVNATINGWGGNGTGVGSSGGWGADVGLYCFGVLTRAPGEFKVTGTIRISGGNGATGGYAGNFALYTYANSVGQAPDAQLLSFAAMTMRGGTATATGGLGGEVFLTAPVGSTIQNDLRSSMDVRGGTGFPSGANGIIDP